jgi:hypothetical protein
MYFLPLLAANLQLFALNYSMLDLAWRCAAPLDSVQGLLLLVDAVNLSVDGRRGGRDLVMKRLVAGGSREISGSNNRSRLDGRVDVLDRSDGKIGAAVGGNGLLVGRDGRAGLINGGGGGSGVLGRRGGEVLLNGSTGKLCGGVLANVALVDGGLLGASNVLLSEADVLRGRLAGSLHGLVGVLGGDLAELLGLLVGDLGGVVKVRVNELLVGNVDQRSEVDDAGRDENQAPLGSDLDEEVADEGSEESLRDVSMLKSIF